MLAALPLLFFSFYRTRGAPSAPTYAQDKRQPDLPIVDYEKEISKPKDPARKQKGERFKGQGNFDRRKAIAQLPDGFEVATTITHWWIGLSALPVDRSDVVIRGTITGREAYLSDDRTGIYSEFLVQVAETFKDSTGTIAAGTPLTVNRSGGRVHFASGKTQEYRVYGQDMPRPGREYVLFLRRTADGDLLILTGYELAYGYVHPLDGEETQDPRSDLPFAKYRGKEATSFLQELRDAATSSNGAFLRLGSGLRFWDSLLT